MKAGDMVRYRGDDLGKVGLVVDIIQKKVWRTQVLGPKVNWDLVDPEPHAVVLWGHNSGAVEVLLGELYLV